MKKNNGESTFHRNLLKIYFTSVGGCIYGYNIGIVSVILKNITETLKLNKFEVSVFSSVFLLGIGLAMPISGFLINIIGRRKQLILGAWLSILSVAMLIGLHENIVFVVVFRFFSGVSCGFLNIAIPLYISETTPANRRGKGTALFQLSLSGGIVFAGLSAIILYRFNSWWMLFIPEILPCLIMIFVAHICWETPNFLVMKGDHASALLSLNKIMDNNCAVKDLIDIKMTVSKSVKFNLLDGRPFLRPIMLCILICGLNQWSGINAFLQYSSYVTSNFSPDVSGASLNDVLWINAINFGATLISIIFIDKMERRHLLQIGLVGASISMAVVCFSGLLPINSRDLAIIKLCGLFGFVVFFALGPGSLVWTIISEILPYKAKGIGMAISLTISSLSASVVTFLFFPLINMYGFDSIFRLSLSIMIIYGIVSAFLPNMTGRSLAEIEFDG